MRRDVAEDQHAARYDAMLVSDRRGAVVDWALRAVAADQHGVIREPDDDALAKRALRRVRNLLARRLVDDAKDGLERLAYRFGLAPARDRCGDRVQVRHLAGDVRRDDGVADAAQGDADHLARLGLLPASDAQRSAERDDQAAREQIGYEAHEDWRGQVELAPWRNE